MIMLASFHAQIVELAKSNYETRLALESQHEETHVQKIQDATDTIVEFIMNSNFQEVISNAASRGYRHCTLFQFSSASKQDNFPLTFLFYGPRKNKGHGSGLSFFKNLDIDYVMKKLSVELSPFKLKIDKIRKHHLTLHYLIAMW